ncbi:hypothetical protein JCM19300_4155 [Algibacter lectus]|uniref:Uncharacterized protein n=1 Tax=Algibacter lectus TaxID=221126 RepID=A0A090VCS5_9FLAO|nr:hypothetical protein JCM19300_4155 [Algibacter lectus]
MCKNTVSTNYNFNLQEENNAGVHIDIKRIGGNLILIYNQGYSLIFSQKRYKLS